MMWPPWSCSAARCSFPMDGDDYIFMDNADFSQYLLKQEDISDELAFITEETEGVLALKVEEAVIGLELPASVVLEVTETTPAMKAASASPAPSRPPEYRPGGAGAGIYRGRRKVRVNTAERKFMSRA